MFLCVSSVLWVSLHLRHQDDVLHISCTWVNNWTKGILKQPSRFSRKLVRQTERELERHGNTTAVFFSMKDQQVLLWTSFLSEEGTEYWDTVKNKRKMTGKRKSRWNDGENVKEKKTEKIQMWRNRTLWSEWVPAVCHSDLKSATGYHLLLLWSVRCEQERGGGSAHCKRWRS